MREGVIEGGCRDGVRGEGSVWWKTVWRWVSAEWYFEEKIEILIIMNRWIDGYMDWTIDDVYVCIMGLVVCLVWSRVWCWVVFSGWDGTFGDRNRVWSVVNWLTTERSTTISAKNQRPKASTKSLDQMARNKEDILVCSFFCAYMTFIYHLTPLWSTADNDPRANLLPSYRARITCGLGWERHPKKFNALYLFTA